MHTETWRSFRSEKTSLELKFVKGQEKPEIQGWYSPEYNIYGPNTASIYQTKIETTTNLVWLLLPSEKSDAKGKGEDTVRE